MACTDFLNDRGMKRQQALCVFEDTLACVYVIQMAYYIVLAPERALKHVFW